MKADLGSVTFDPAKQFLRVVMQQGRVQLESDWNEQVAILVYGLRTLAADLIGPWGGSAGAFNVAPISDSKGDFSLGTGHYYVDGIRIAAEPADGETVSYLNQPFPPRAYPGPLRCPPGSNLGNFLVYLDLWERLITAAEDEGIREVALGGPDTAARSQVVWQVRAGQFQAGDLDNLNCHDAPDMWPGLLDLLYPPARGRLRARARVPQEELDRPCAVDPRASFRGDENALIRVEVHAPGPAGTATFKWSFDNGAVTFPIESFGGEVLRLTTLGRDTRLTLSAGDWVELEDDAAVLSGAVNPLFRVHAVDYTDLTVTLEGQPAPSDAAEHPRLRRWDQKGTRSNPLRSDGTVTIVESAGVEGKWLSLGQGVQIQFAEAEAGDPLAEYRGGDYWLIPARTVIGDIIWPQETAPDGSTQPAARPPAGVEHHYAPLAWITVAPDGTVEVVESLVRTIKTAGDCPSGA